MLALLFLLASCSVYQDIYLDSDGSGKATGRVLLDDFYLNTLEDLTDLSSPAPGSSSPMDPDTIAAELSANPYFRGVQISSPAPGIYQGGLQFHNVEALFSTEEGRAGTILGFERNSGSSTLNLRINSDNFQEMFRLFPMLQDPGFQYFLPEPDISRSEYTEMLLFLFEDQHKGDEDELQTRVEKASLDLTIHTEGRILSSIGGERTGDREWKIQLPLLDLLLHRQELFYSVTFQ